MIDILHFPLPGLLQLTALHLIGLAAVDVGSTGFNSATVRPQTRFYAIQQAPDSSAMFTFNQPGKSFVEYRHVWPSITSAVTVNVRLRFRTARSSGILAVLSSVSAGPRTTSNVSGAVLPTTMIRLHRGSLHVSVSTSRDQNGVEPAQSGLVVGRGLFYLFFFTARCTTVQSAVLRSHVVCPSVSPSVRPLDLMSLQHLALAVVVLVVVATSSKSPRIFVFTARCTIVHSAVLRLHVVCLSVCL